METEIKESKKRIVLLYRASSKKQTDSENDIPLQRNILRPWAEKQGYVFVKELVEGGVSGFKVSAEKRDAIQEIKRMAINKEFDVLGVYMSDRLGRIAQETPLIITFLNSHGIEVVSFREGPIQCETHSDKLMTYIRFWQAEGESLKTSARVRDTHEQMVRSGKLRGGAPYYGYKSVSRGTLNFKGRPVFDTEIDPEQADTVRLIFQLYTTGNYGVKGIAKVLNDKGVPTQTGILWSHTTVMQVLRNKMYLGIYELDKSKKNKPSILSPVMPQYVIVDQATFDKAQEVIAKNTVRKTGFTAQRVTVHGSQILTGLLYCGECGRKFTGYHRSSFQSLKTGDKLYRSACYRCNSFRFPKERKETCHQRLYNQELLDYLVIKDAKEFLSEADKSKVLLAHKTKIEERIAEAAAHYAKAEGELAKKETETARLKDEIMKALLGQSSVELSVLNELLKTKESEKAQASEALLEVQENVLRLDAELAARVEIMSGLATWEERFESQSHAVRKTMLMNIIDRITATDDMIEVRYKIPLTLAETEQPPSEPPVTPENDGTTLKTALFTPKNCVQGVALSNVWR